MAWALSALGIRPCTPPTCQPVCKVVTSISEKTISYFLSFQSLARTLSEMRIPQPSCSQRVPHSLRKPPGVGTPPMIHPFFSAPYALLKILLLPTHPRVLFLPLCFFASLRRVYLPSSYRWSPVALRRKMRSIPFLLMPLQDPFSPNQGEYTPLHRSGLLFRRIQSPCLCASVTIPPPSSPRFFTPTLECDTLCRANPCAKPRSV
jgi:hypothetical protein